MNHFSKLSDAMILLWWLGSFPGKVEAQQRPASYYESLIQYPLATSNNEKSALMRALEETPAEEEGHPQQVDALYQGYGEHYVDLWCGNPPQRQTLIINTGGHGTAFPCSECQDNCGEGHHIDKFYDESKSLTFHKMSCEECEMGICTNKDRDPSKTDYCQFGIFYEENSSWLAAESSDHCYIGGLHNKPESIDNANQDDLDPEHAVSFAFNLRFGCQTVITGYFQSQMADGILAMDHSGYSFWQQMHQAGKLEREEFSLCYARQPHAWKNGTESGAMTLGGSDDRLHLHPMVFSRHEDVWERNYGVLLRKIYLREGGGGDSARSTDPSLKTVALNISAEELNLGGVIIESGTTDTYMTSELAGPFREIWTQMTSVRYDTEKALMLSREEVQQLPTILFQIEGSKELNEQVSSEAVNLAGDIDPDHPYDIIIAMPPNHYMKYISSEKLWIPRFFMGEHPSGTSILGANTMMGHDILFDAKNNRVGWAESHCDYTHLIVDAGYDESHKDVPYVPQPEDENTRQTNGHSEWDETTGTSGFGWTVPILILVVGGMSVLVARRQPGRLGQITRRWTGAGEYRGMPSTEDVAELELQVSYSPRAEWT